MRYPCLDDRFFKHEGQFLSPASRRQILAWHGGVPWPVSFQIDTAFDDRCANSLFSTLSATTGTTWVTEIGHWRTQVARGVMTACNANPYNQAQ